MIAIWDHLEWDLEVSEMNLEVLKLVGINTSWTGEGSKMPEDS